MPDLNPWRRLPTSWSSGLEAPLSWLALASASSSFLGEQGLSPEQKRHPTAGCPLQAAPGTQISGPAPSLPCTPLPHHRARRTGAPPVATQVLFLSWGSFSQSLCPSARTGHPRVGPQLHTGIRDHAQTPGPCANLGMGRRLPKSLPFPDSLEFLGRSMTVKPGASTLRKRS